VILPLAPRIVPGSGQAIAANTATQIAGTATDARLIRVVWAAAGAFAFGQDNTVDPTNAAQAIQLPATAGVEFFNLGSDQVWIKSTVAITINLAKNS
jgi:hypothetical protein